jgi:anti-sigma factor RsiW
MKYDGRNMTMGKADDERLQRYFDDELAAAERAQVEAGLSDEDRLKLAAMAELRGLLTNALTPEAADIDLWSAIAPAVELPASKAELKAQRRWGMRAHPASWSAGLATAAAAALLFVFQPWHPSGPGNGCDIELLETSGAMATVIALGESNSRGAEAPTLIWTEEQD